ncbi:MAG: pyruvate dehydrogenase (acetyl-transferring), homodimeric type, partial [Pseudomonas sp.]|nr:pyruvate dehydrogenase (acetyl-transferring), homodimeric type [Pseudomonas sp.]
MNANNAVRLDDDPQETREWLESIESVLSTEGRPRAHYLIDQLLDFDVARHGDFHGRVTTPYVNTIAVDRQLPYPGNLAIERRLNAFIRWNAMA